MDYPVIHTVSNIIKPQNVVSDFFYPQVQQNLYTQFLQHVFLTLDIFVVDKLYDNLMDYHAKVPLYAIQAMMKHSNTAETAIYIKVNDSFKQEALNQLVINGRPSWG